jgi:hypothetical protein
LRRGTRNSREYWRNSSRQLLRKSSKNRKKKRHRGKRNSKKRRNRKPRRKKRPRPNLS